jgi:hypothetical protein
MLAGSVHGLKNHNIVYRVPHDRRNAARGAISSGNGHVLVESLDGTLDPVFRYRPNVSLLFSREQLMRELIEPARIGRFQELLDVARFDRVEILLFIRNPIGHAASQYQQSVKGAGRKKSIDDFFEKYPQPANVKEFLQAFEQIRNTRVTVRNYSAGKGKLREIIADWVGLPAAVFNIPNKITINRSLSFSETELQRELNALLGRRANFLSTRLCESVPDIQAEHMFPSEEIQRKLWQRLEESINWVNAKVEPEHAYVFDFHPVDSTPPAGFCFNKAQIQAVASAIADEILQLEAEVTALRTDPFSLWADKQDK